MFSIIVKYVGFATSLTVGQDAPPSGVTVQLPVSEAYCHLFPTT